MAKIASFSSLFNLQSNSTNFNFSHFWAKYQGYSLTFWPKLPHFHHFSICSQNTKATKIFNLSHFWAKYQGYSLTFWPKFFITFQSAVKLNQFHLVIFGQNTKSFLAKIAQIHHFSICSQTQPISILVIFGQ